jgi:hypothetical protein
MPVQPRYTKEEAFRRGEEIYQRDVLLSWKGTITASMSPLISRLPIGKWMRTKSSRATACGPGFQRRKSG